MATRPQIHVMAHWASVIDMGEAKAITNELMSMTAKEHATLMFNFSYTETGDLFYDMSFADLDAYRLHQRNVGHLVDRLQEVADVRTIHATCTQQEDVPKVRELLAHFTDKVRVLHVAACKHDPSPHKPLFIIGHS